MRFVIVLFRVQSTGATSQSRVQRQGSEREEERGRREGSWCGDAGEESLGFSPVTSFHLG